MKSVMGLVAGVAFLFWAVSVNGGEVLNPAEDREVIHNNSHETTFLREDGSGSLRVRFGSVGNLEEGQVVMKYDLSAYRGLQFANVLMSFKVWRAEHYETLSIDTMFYEGDGTIVPEDFNRGTHYLGTFPFDIPAGSYESYDVEQRVEYDVTELVNSRSSDYVYFNNRLSGEYPDFAGNVFADTDPVHLIYIYAVENQPLKRPFMELTSPFVSAGPDRRVYGTVSLDGSGSYDPDHDIVSYDWTLKCRGNSAFDRSASGAQVTVSNLKPGFYDGNLTVTNDQGEQGSANFVVFSGIGPQGDCEGDFDGDGDVDGSDLAVFAADFGRTDCP